MDKWCPPPVNASNLNDISNALQAVNITQQERTALGAQENDTLGQILEALKNVVDRDISKVESTISTIQSMLKQKGNCQIKTGSYVGSGTNSPTLNTGFYPMMVVIATYNKSASWSSGDSTYILFIRGTNSYYIAADTYSNNSAYAYYVTFSNNSISWSCSNSYFSKNMTGETYFYCVIGTV